MGKRKSRLTPALHSQIVASIRSGGYVHVAAEAWGIPQGIFEEWLVRGDRQGAREPYASLAAEVRTARAQARLRAETEAFKRDARSWLEHGPGRETMGNPGWTTAVKAVEEDPLGSNPLLQPELMELFRSLLEVLEPYPEARAQAARVLAGREERRSEPRGLEDPPAGVEEKTTDGGNHGVPETSIAK